MDLIGVYVLIVLAFAFCCYTAGELVKARRQYKADMDMLDKWATEQEARFRRTA